MRRLLLSLALVPIMVQQGIPTMCYRGKAMPNVDPKEAHCLAVMVYGESRGESELGQVAVAFTAVNRAVKKQCVRWFYPLSNTVYSTVTVYCELRQ